MITIAADKLNVEEIDALGTLAVYYGVESMAEAICCCLEDCLDAIQEIDSQEAPLRLEHNPGE